MPNWVNNTMRVSKQDLFRIVNKQSKVDFNLAFPMPTTLQCDSGSMNDYEVYYYLSDRCAKPCSVVAQMPLAQKLITNSIHNGPWIDEVHNRLTTQIMTKPNFDANAMYSNGQTLVTNYQTYGAVTWYEWCTSNWGCKWNADTYQISDDPNDINYSILYFSTPWSPPSGWLEKLAEFKIAFHCEWIEEQGYHGEFISDGTGDIEHNDLPFVDPDDDADGYDDGSDDED